MTTEPSAPTTCSRGRGVPRGSSRRSSSILLTMLGAAPPAWYTDVQGDVVLVCVVVACVLPFVNRDLHNRGPHRPDEVAPPGRASAR